MIAQAVRAKLREHGAARVAGDAVAAVASAIFWVALYGTLAGLLVGIGIPALGVDAICELIERRSRAAERRAS